MQKPIGSNQLTSGNSCRFWSGSQISERPASCTELNQNKAVARNVHLTLSNCSVAMDSKATSVNTECCSKKASASVMTCPTLATSWPSSLQTSRTSRLRSKNVNYRFQTTRRLATWHHVQRECVGQGGQRTEYEQGG